MIKMQLSQAAKALNVQFDGEDLEFVGAHNDTRVIEPGNLYFAIKGAHTDGHEFLAQAKQAGAVAAVVEQFVDSSLPQIIVADATLAMGQLAKYWREQFTIPIVGITGSVGKTTTRQMVGAILNEMGETLISEGNKNNFYGVPLTLFRLGPEHKFAVIEMGADRPGEITYLTNIVQPDVATVTMVAPVHIEVSHGIGFGSVDAVLKEKTQIFAQLPKHGIAVLNADSPYIDFWRETLAEQPQITFGLNYPANITAHELHPNDNMQYKFILNTPIGSDDITLSSLGRHNVINAVCASAIAIAVGASLDNIHQGLANVPTVARRMIRKVGVKGALVIDDSYNANVVATKAVLEMLADYEDKKRIMVLGDMRELGDMSKELHQEIGLHAKKLALQHFFAVGPETAATIAALDEPWAKHFDTHEALVAELKPLMDENTVVMVKGSLGSQMNKVVDPIVEMK